MMILLQCQGKAAATPAEATGAVAAEEGEGFEGAGRSEPHDFTSIKLKIGQIGYPLVMSK